MEKFVEKNDTDNLYSGWHLQTLFWNFQTKTKIEDLQHLSVRESFWNFQLGTIKTLWLEFNKTNVC